MSSLTSKTCASASITIANIPTQSSSCYIENPHVKIVTLKHMLILYNNKAPAVVAHYAAFLQVKLKVAGTVGDYACKSCNH